MNWWKFFTLAFSPHLALQRAKEAVPDIHGSHSLQSISDLPNLWRPLLYCWPSFFQFCPSPLPAFLITLFLWVNVLSHHSLYVILLNGIMDLNLLRLCTITTLLSVLCKRHRINWRLDTDDIVFAITLIWYHKHK